MQPVIAESGLEPMYCADCCLEHLFRQQFLPARLFHSFHRKEAMGVKDDLRQRYATLSPALQQVAKYVLDHPNDVVTASMRTVGTQAGSKPATLVRFAQQLGFV